MLLHEWGTWGVDRGWMPLPDIVTPRHLFCPGIAFLMICMRRRVIEKLSQSYAYGYDADQLRGNVLEQASQLTVNDVKKISMNDE